MKANESLVGVDLKLRYKRAFLFFGITFIFNIIFNPLLIGFGMDAQMGSFLVNGLGITIAASYIGLKVNGWYKNLRQSVIMVGLIGIVSLLVCYYLIFVV